MFLGLRTPPDGIIQNLFCCKLNLTPLMCIMYNEIVMKTMTCKQLYGPCDTLIHGETAEEMMENSKKHAMEMAAKGDQIHIDAIKTMGQSHQNMDEAAAKQWMDKFQNDFDTVPED